MLKLLLQDIRRSPAQFLIVSVQIIFALIILCYSFSLILEGRDSVTKLKELDSSGSIYKLTEYLESEEIDQLINDENGGKSLYDLKKYIESNEDIQCIVSKNSTNFILDTENSTFNLDAAKKFLTIRNGQTFAEMIEINDDFFEFYDIEGVYSLDTGSEDTKAIILGYDFSESCKIGDIIYDFLGEKYEITGFLPKGAYYVNPFEQWEPFYLDDYFITKESVREDDAMSTFINIMSTLIVAKDESAIDEILMKADALGIGVFEAADYSARVDSKIMDIYNSVMTMIFIAFLVLLFCSIGFIVNMVRFINSNMVEFAIHMLCGADKNHIIRRICLQMGSIILLSIIIVIIVCGVSTASLMTVAAAALYGAVVLIYPVIILKRVNIVDIRKKM